MEMEQPDSTTDLKTEFKAEFDGSSADMLGANFGGVPPGMGHMDPGFPGATRAHPGADVKPFADLAADMRSDFERMGDISFDSTPNFGGIGASNMAVPPRFGDFDPSSLGHAGSGYGTAFPPHMLPHGLRWLPTPAILPTVPGWCVPRLLSPPRHGIPTWYDEPSCSVRWRLPTGTQR